MIWFLAYLAICVAIGLVFGAFAWGDDEGNAPIVMASILVAFVWPLAVLGWVYVIIDDHIISTYYERKHRPKN